MANQYKSLNQAIEKHASLDVIKDMLSNGADIHERDGEYENYTPLHNAAICGDMELINLLIESGADIFSRDTYGRTPLHSAIEFCKIDNAKLLIKLGADVNDTRIDGCAAIGMIGLGEADVTDMLNMLLEAGADLHNSNGTGETYLQSIFNRSREFDENEWRDARELTSICLKQGLDINERNDEGNTPILQYYANSVEDEFEMETRVIKLLIDNGADVTMASEQDGLSLLDHVNNGDIKNKDVCELILKTANK